MALLSASQDKKGRLTMNMQISKCMALVILILAGTGCQPGPGNQIMPSKVLPTVDAEAATRKMDADIEMLSKALLSYKTDLGEFPGSEQGIRALSTLPDLGSRSASWKGPYLVEVPHTPWNGDYLYELRTLTTFIEGQDGETRNSSQKGYIISVKSPEGFTHIVPKNQFGSLPEGSWLRLPGKEDLGLRGPGNLWRWYDR